MSFLWVSSLRLLCSVSSLPLVTQESGIIAHPLVVLNTDFMLGCYLLNVFTIGNVVIYHNLNVVQDSIFGSKV